MSTEISLISGAFNSPMNFDFAQRIGKFLSTSTFVPAAYQGNMSNCMVAIEMSARMNVSVIQIMQNMYVVHGTPAWASKFKISQANSSGLFTKIKYEWRGKQGDPNWGCRSYATDLETNEVCYGVWVDWTTVLGEGWKDKKGSKWNTMPEKMFMYRAASWWVDLFAPETTFGIQTVEEVTETLDIDYEDVTERVKAQIKNETGTVPTDFPETKVETKPEVKPDVKAEEKKEPEVKPEKTPKADKPKAQEATPPAVESKPEEPAASSIKPNENFDNPDEIEKDPF